MKVLVTGASGYIGRYLISELLKHDHQVICLIHKSPMNNLGVEIYKGDITKHEELKDAFREIDAVMHNAAYAIDWGSKKRIYDNNVIGTRNIAMLCSKFNVPRIVYTSSAGVYGFPNVNSEITEESPTKPFNAYHKSKLKGEILFSDYPELNVSMVRAPLVLGGGGKAGQIITEGIYSGKMKYVGSGENVTSIVHPKDVAQCLRLTLERDTEGGIFNVVSFTCSIKELFEEIAKNLGIQPPRKKVPYLLAYPLSFFTELFAQGEPSLTRYRIKLMGTTRRISCKKAKDKLGYRPLFNLATTAEDMASAIKKNGEA